MKKLFYLPAIVFFSFISCQKADESTDVIPEISAKAKMLASGSWKITEWKYTNNGVTEDVLVFSVACERDDKFTFKDDGTWKRDENTQKCNFVAGYDTRKFDGTWKLQENDSKIMISGFSTDSGNTIWELTELSESTLQISFTQSGTNIYGPYTAKNLITFKH